MYVSLITLKLQLALLLAKSEILALHSELQFKGQHMEPEKGGCSIMKRKSNLTINNEKTSLKRMWNLTPSPPLNPRQGQDWDLKIELLAVALSRSLGEWNQERKEFGKAYERTVASYRLKIRYNAPTFEGDFEWDKLHAEFKDLK